MVSQSRKRTKKESSNNMLSLVNKNSIEKDIVLPESKPPTKHSSISFATDVKGMNKTQDLFKQIKNLNKSTEVEKDNYIQDKNGKYERIVMNTPYERYIAKSPINKSMRRYFFCLIFVRIKPNNKLPYKLNHSQEHTSSVLNKEGSDLLTKLIRAKSKRFKGKNIGVNLISNDLKSNSIQSKTPQTGSRSGFRNQAIKELNEWREMPPTTLERLENR